MRFNRIRIQRKTLPSGYSDVPDYEKVVNKGRDPYIEAIVGAVFYDSNYDTTKRWILKWLLPLLINESECGIN